MELFDAYIILSDLFSFKIVVKTKLSGINVNCYLLLLIKSIDIDTS